MPPALSETPGHLEHTPKYLLKWISNDYRAAKNVISSHIRVKNVKSRTAHIPGNPRSLSNLTSTTTREKKIGVEYYFPFICHF